MAFLASQGMASALAQTEGRNLLVVCAALEEAGRWAAQLEAMGWQTVHFTYLRGITTNHLTRKLR